MDIIVTDVMMPVMDGIKLCKNVKQNIRTCHIPVIILSAKEIFEAAKKAKIYVRYFDQPRINNYLRITIGTREEMETLLDFLKEFTATK